jgi:hypothetical protein
VARAGKELIVVAGEDSGDIPQGANESGWGKGRPISRGEKGLDAPGGTWYHNSKNASGQPVRESEAVPEAAPGTRGVTGVLHGVVSNPPEDWLGAESAEQWCVQECLSDLPWGV